MSGVLGDYFLDKLIDACSDAASAHLCYFFVVSVPVGTGLVEEKAV
jgi:hypothetical protein